MAHSTSMQPAVIPLTPYQKLVTAILAFLQFTIVLDFMIISPMGAILMPALDISPKQFGLVVSAYAFSAGISGLLAAGFADRFDRKKLLLFFYSGFLVGTFFCGLANSYEYLLIARIVTGFFGGVIGSVSMAIATDLFSIETRGRVIGYMQTSFGASQILGIPLGLWLSNHVGWHAAFFMIVIVSFLVGIVIVLKIKPINAHLKLQKDSSPMLHFWNTLTNSRYTLAFLTTALLSVGGFMLMPFSSAFTVNNVGIPVDQLPLLYFITGFGALFAGPLIGRASDAFGKLKVFIFGAILTNVMAIIYTNLGHVSLMYITAVNVLLYIGVFSRIIPSQALISSIPDPDSRGSFTAVNASLQQMAGGIASVMAGLIVVETSTGALEHFDTLAYILCCTVFITVCSMWVINRAVQKKLKTNPSQG